MTFRSFLFSVWFYLWMLVYGALALAAARGRDALIGNPSVTVWIGRGAGALFILAALFTAWHGLTVSPGA